MDRERMLLQLAQDKFDLLVIGGGITGLGVAREAALRGIKAAVVERADFAYGTSSRSTKLIHGGLRYLRNFEFRLVREAVEERERLIQMAPHLVHPMGFALPVYTGDPDPIWKVKIGLMLYDWFAGRTNQIPHRMFGAGGLLQEEPLLREEGLRGGFIYADAATDDGRLVLEVLRSAAILGVPATNYTEVIALLKNGQGQVTGVQVRDRLTGEQFPVQASLVINAAGPWVDHVRRLDDPNLPGVLRLTKGVHLTIPQDRLPLRHSVFMRGVDNRLMFAVPSHGFTYVGTTDTDHKADPEDLHITRWDIEYIVAAAQKNFPAAGVTLDDVVAAWVGLRPLLKSDAENPSAASRDYKIFHHPSGLVTIGGGKLTAFRAMASHVVDDVFPASKAKSDLATSMAPLPGAPAAGAPIPGDPKSPFAGDLAAIAAATGEPLAEVQRVANRYGSFFAPVLAEYRDLAGSHPAGLAWQKAQVRHAVRAEMAQRLDDILRRRTSLMLFSLDNGATHLQALADEMAGLLGWGTDRVNEEVARCRQLIREMHAWKGEAPLKIAANG